MSEHSTKRPNITPAHAAKVAEIALKRAGVEGARVTSQAMFNRASKGSIASNYAEWLAAKQSAGQNPSWHVELDGEAFATWLKAFVQKKLTGSAGKVDHEELANLYA